MFEIIDALIGIGAAAGVATYISKKRSAIEVNEKVEEIKAQVVQHATPVKQADAETTHRLDALEELLETNQPMGVSTERVAVKVLYITEGIRYHFHYLHRPEPFLTLTFQKATQYVSKDYIMEELMEDKQRIKQVIKRLSEKIVGERGMEATEVSKLAEHPDPVFKKAAVILQKAKEMETVLLPSEVEYAKTHVDKILNAYEPLKEATKRLCQDEVFLALGKIEQRLTQVEETIEKQKIERLKEEIDTL